MIEGLYSSSPSFALTIPLSENAHGEPYQLNSVLLMTETCKDRDFIVKIFLFSYS